MGNLSAARFAPSNVQVTKQRISHHRDNGTENGNYCIVLGHIVGVVGSKEVYYIRVL